MFAEPFGPTAFNTPKTLGNTVAKNQHSHPSILQANVSWRYNLAMMCVALLRGIGPSNPNMHGAKLKEATEKAGFSKVQTLLSSGNIIFESNSKDQAALEAKLEKTWPA